MNQTLALRSAHPRASQLWRDYPREAVALAILGCTAIAALGNAAWGTPTFQGIRGGDTVQEPAPPAPPPLLVRQLAPDDAVAINESIPLENSPNPAARPFTLAGESTADRMQALDCLASAVYYEAGSEDTDGQRAVAQVVLNRVRHPAFPSSVCGVVYQGSTRATGCQFTFTCDGSLERRPSTEGWARAQDVAEAALNGYVFKPVGYATHYHADYVVPYWASSLAKNAVMGAHIFYRWAGSWGRPGAFAQHYSKHEPNSQALRSAALAAEANAANAAEDAIAAIPGAEELGTVPGDGDGRVAIRFNIAARKAVENAPHVAYVEKVEASDNLRWSLGDTMAKPDAKPLGTPVSAPAATSDKAPVAAGLPAAAAATSGAVAATAASAGTVAGAAAALKQ
jgi:spore germination cell wall hydrolase CwlJ-like protein